LKFVPLPPPTQDDIAFITHRLARRLGDVARRFGAVDDDNVVVSPGGDASEAETGSLGPEHSPAMLGALATALRAPAHHRPQPALPFDTDLAALASARRDAFQPKPLCASVQGFSLHAATAIDADDRAGLERLCRYGLRAPYSVRRFSELPDGRIRYELRRPWPTAGGTTELDLEPLDLLRRLAAIMPAPYSNMVRYHGVFASRSKYTRRLPPPGGSAHVAEAALARDEHKDDEAPAHPDANTDGTEAPVFNASNAVDAGPVAQAAQDEQPPTPPKGRYSWATLLKRALDIDALSCSKCHGVMVVLAFINDPQVMRKILSHLRLPTRPPPLAPARYPEDDEVGQGDEWFEDQTDLDLDFDSDLDVDTDAATTRAARAPPPGRWPGAGT